MTNEQAQALNKVLFTDEPTAEEIKIAQDYVANRNQEWPEVNLDEDYIEFHTSRNFTG